MAQFCQPQDHWLIKNNGPCLACVYWVMDACGNVGECKGSVRVACILHRIFTNSPLSFFTH